MRFQHSWLALFREQVETALTGESSGLRGTLRLHCIFHVPSQFSQVLSRLLPKKKVLSRRRRIHHLYFFFRQEGSPSYKFANHSTTACLILPLLNEQLKSSKILLLEVINPKKKRSWMLFFHTQLMPPVLGYYRRPAVRPALTKPTAGRPPWLASTRTHPKPGSNTQPWRR